MDADGFSVIGPASDGPPTATGVSSAQVPLPHYIFTYLQPDLLDTMMVSIRPRSLAKFEENGPDIYEAQRQLSFGSDTIQAELAGQSGSFRLGVTTPRAARTLRIAEFLARSMVPIDVADLQTRARRQQAPGLVVPGLAMFLCGRVRSGSDLGEKSITLHSGRARNVSQIVDSRDPHQLAWSKALFRSRVFVLGLVGEVADSGVGVQAAAILF